MAGRTFLSQELVGSRVVVRRVLAGRQGPTGAPLMTDIVGVLVAWSPTSLTVRGADGIAVDVNQGVVVAAKEVPPAPPPRPRGERD